MRYIYTSIFYLAVPFIWFFMWLKGRKNPDYAKRHMERYGFYKNLLKPKPKGIVVHASSVGEVMVATPLVKALQARYPDLAITFTCMTPTGSDQIKKTFGESVTHCYLPFDLPFAIKRFLRFIDPKAVIIIETELWANLFYALKRQNIALMIANARLSARSSARYAKFQKTMGEILQCVDLIAAQDKLSAERYLAIGATPEQVKVTGNIKYDLTPSAKIYKKINENRGVFNKRPVWVAASTHEGEEEIILAAHQKLRTKFPDLLLVLVPRHLERFDAVADLIKAKNLSFVRRSEHQVVKNEAVLLADTMGELLFFYGLCDVAFIGGSLITRGGHNPLEAAAFKKPIVSGIEVFNFQDVYQQLNDAKAVSWADKTVESVANEVGYLLQNPQERTRNGEAAYAVLQRNQGALEKLLGFMQPYLENNND